MRLLACLVACVSIVACGSCGPISPMIYTDDVPNLDQVDPNVYRSGQITTSRGWDTIAKIAAGRKIHVIKLNFDAEGSGALAVARGYDVEALSIQPEGDQDIVDDILGTFKHPDERLVDEAEAILEKAKTTQATDFYLVHCTHGQDRTGYVIGKHRVLHDGWTKAAAYSEMRAHNFHWELHGLEDAWQDWKP
jgi:protein tyrosine/serine phosphatase